jgi:hypothetical protein
MFYRIVDRRPGTVIHTKFGWVEPNEKGIARLTDDKKSALEAMGITLEPVDAPAPASAPEPPVDPDAQSRIAANRSLNDAIAQSAGSGDIPDHARRAGAARKVAQSAQ